MGAPRASRGRQGDERRIRAQAGKAAASRPGTACRFARRAEAPPRDRRAGAGARAVTDVVIVGAGPAGIAAALALHARGLGGVVAERRLRGTRGTPGETLPGRVRSALAALGIAAALGDDACTPVHTH